MRNRSFCYNGHAVQHPRVEASHQCSTLASKLHTTRNAVAFNAFFCEDLVLPVPIFQVRPIRVAEPTAGLSDIAMLEEATLSLIVHAVLMRRC